ncbi:MAG: pyridoxal phosphate-dependent aminotransferase family protein [Leptospira sp.]|nr:pyridoxal phosphate-dependent aminotransferase family protein [Leptospira sp.]
MNTHWEDLQNQIDIIKKKSLYRKCVETSGIDFCSNDYLGLASNDELKEEFIKNARLHTTGSTASRLVKGHRKEMTTFEQNFSEFVGTEASLIVSTGYVANMGLIDTIADSQTIIFTDRLNHASILDGIRISGGIKKYYHHLDMDHLEFLLESISLEPNYSKKKKIIVSETLFSMDGDSPDLKRLMKIKRRFDCTLILDEAHALGVFGDSGRGMCFEQLESEEIKNIEYRIYTLGKSLGLEGGIISTSMIGREFLVNRMRAFIYSTAPMPIISATASKSLQMLKMANRERTHLKFIAETFRMEMIKLGYSLSPSSSHIIPVLMDTEEIALEYSDILKDKGYDIRAIRPPTVPTPRLRVSLNAKLKTEDINSLLRCFAEIKQGKSPNQF